MPERNKASCSSSSSGGEGGARSDDVLEFEPVICASFRSAGTKPGGNKGGEIGSVAKVVESWRRFSTCENI